MMPTTPETCPSCFRRVQSDAAFCSLCGSRVRREGHIPPSQPSSHGADTTLLAEALERSSGGRYLIEGESEDGEGGPAFLARDREQDRAVVLQVLSHSRLPDEEKRSRLLEEARVMATLRHECLRTLHGVGEAGGLHFLVLDRAEGLTLDHLLRTQGPLAIPQVESIFQQVGKALAYLHGPPWGLVHRGVRPENIWVKEEGNAILQGFGISRRDHWDGADVSTGLVLENTEYMSPEECRGLAPTSRSDQYALGVVAYAMLAGRPPFVGAFYRVLVAHLSEGFVPLLQLRPDCPPRLASAVERMLSKDPAARWRDVSQAVQAALVGPVVDEVELPAPDHAVGDTPPGPSGSPGDRTGFEVLPPTGGSEAEESLAPHPEDGGSNPIMGDWAGEDLVPGFLDPGPDLGPPPSPAFHPQEEEEDEPDEIGPHDRASLFFEPTSPPPEAEWATATDDGEVKEPVGMSLVSAPPTTPPAPPPDRPVPRRAPPRPRRRRTRALLLLALAGGTGWGVWGLLYPPDGRNERSMAQGSDHLSQFGGTGLGPDDDRGLMLLPPPEGGLRTPSPEPAPLVESSPRTDTPAPPVSDRQSEPAPPEPTAPDPIQAQAPPRPTARTAPEELAPAVLGRLAMNIRPWADVLVNGVPRGRFQTRIELELPAGTHFVRMSNPNFPPFDTTVVVQGGETTVLNKVLQPDSEP